MTQEARVNGGLTIRKTSGSITLIDYNSKPTAFTATVDGSVGPVPGAFLVDAIGVDVDLSQLTTPGLCRMMNQSSTETIEWGAWDLATGRFLPVGEMLPGEFFPMRLAENLGNVYGAGGGTGTGTLGTIESRLRFRSKGGDCYVLVEAFEK